jgi:hypothetical protein
MAVQPAYQNAIWMFDDASGRTATNKLNTSALVDLALNGGFETAGAGGADVWAWWMETVGNGAIADETTIVHSGGHAVKLTAGSSANTFVQPVNVDNSALFYFRVLPGMSVTLSFWTRGDGSNAGRYLIKDKTHNTNIVAVKSTEVSGTTYTQIIETFTTPAGCYDLNIALYCPTVNGGIAYFDDFSVVGTMRLDGIYAAAGVTYGQPGPISGYASVALSGADTSVLVGSPAYNAKFNGDKGSVICWGKVDGAARWNDTSTHRYLYHIKARPSSIHYVAVGTQKTATNRIGWLRNAGGTAYTKYYDFTPAGTTDWFCMGMTWDVTSTPKRIACYLYTAADKMWQKVSDEEPAVGNEHWDQVTYPADDLNADVLGGTGLATQEWIGNGGPIVEWAGVALSDGEMRMVMTP